jgi:hypothetical protein
MQTIKCEIVRAWLDPPPEYIAVSYTWGDADDTRHIVLVEEPAAPVEDRLGVYERETIQNKIPVAASLHGALGALRQRDRDVYVWVDALCKSILPLAWSNKCVSLPDVYRFLSEATILHVMISSTLISVS